MLLGILKFVLFSSFGSCLVSIVAVFSGFLVSSLFACQLFVVVFPSSSANNSILFCHDLIPLALVTVIFSS